MDNRKMPGHRGCLSDLTFGRICRVATPGRLPGVAKPQIAGTAEPACVGDSTDGQLRIRAASARIDLLAAGTDILALSKMNWNNAQFEET